MQKRKKLYQNDFKKIFGLEYTDHTLIKDKRLLEWDIYKDKEYTVNPKLNEKLTQKYGHLIEVGHHAPIFIRWINKTIEYGAYADADIKMGDLVTEYTGIVEHDEPFDDDNLYLWDYPTVIYETEAGKKRRKKIRFCVNAEKVGNYARFINHSLRKYQNVGIQIVAHKKFWHVLYVAKRDIKKGEQLLTYYGLQYWKDRNIVPLTITPDR